MKRIVHLYVLSFILDVCKCDLYCTSTDTCTPDKPFCTNLGCVFECPKSAYINGTYCVVDCGDWFVYNGTCVNNCPSETTFTREIPKLIGREIYMEKLCVSTCSLQEYIFNDTCVRACPTTHRYISGQKCVLECPEDAPFMTNFTVNEMIYHKCETQCRNLVENGYCTDQCSVHLTVFNDTCVSLCPTTYPLMYERNCVRTCPDTTLYVENNTCMSKCPLKEPNIYKGKCVRQCPAGLFKFMENGTWYCAENCSNDLFAYNQICVSTCPHGTVIDNKTCATNCSDELPFLCEINGSPHSACGATDDEFSTIHPQQTYHTCVKQCPDSKYISNSSCVTACPVNYNYLKTRCVQNCPVDFPYLYNKTDVKNCGHFGCFMIKPTCMEECPLHTYRYKKTCYDACPGGLYTSTGKCVTACDNFTPFIKNKTITYRTYVQLPHGWKTMDIKANIVECVSNCGPGFVRFNNTCAKKCPENIKYVTNRTCHETECDTKYMYNGSLYIECSDMCEDDHYIYDKLCLKHCPESTLVYNRTCVSVCPDSSSLILNKDVGLFCSAGHCARVKKFCVETCIGNMFVLNQTCVPFCPKHTFIYNKTCVSVCPDKTSPHRNFVLSQYKGSIECLSRCPQGTLIFNQTCYPECPEGTYSLNNYTCVHKCPAEKPLGFTGLTGYDKWKCIRSCRDGQVFENGSCQYSCTDPAIAFEGKCIEQCPEGYIFWFDRCYNIIYDLVFGILLFVGIDIAILSIGRQILKEYLIVVAMAMSLIVRPLIKDRESQPTDSSEGRKGENNGYCAVVENDIEMDIITDDQMNLISFEKDEDEDTTL